MLYIISSFGYKISSSQVSNYKNNNDQYVSYWIEDNRYELWGNRDMYYIF